MNDPYLTHPIEPVDLLREQRAAIDRLKADNAKLRDVGREVRDIALDVKKLGDFVRRPDLNVEIIQSLDFQAAKLQELAEALGAAEAKP